MSQPDSRLKAFVRAITEKKTPVQMVPVWTAKQLWRKGRWRYVSIGPPPRGFGSKGFAWTTGRLPKVAETRFRQWAAVKIRIRKKPKRAGDPWSRFTPYGSPVFFATRKAAEKKAKEWARKAAQKGKE